MGPRHRSSGRQSLTQGLDREVYQVVRKIADERSQYGEDYSTGRLSFAQIYDEIKRSNSSLNRKPKKLLEDSIERVLDTINADAAGEESDDGMDGVEDETLAQPRPSNGLNKSIIGAWATNNAVPSRTATSTPKKEDQDRKRERDRQTNGEPLPKRRKVAPSIDKSPPTHLSLADLGGVDDVVGQLVDLLALPMWQPHLFASEDIQPTRGVLLCGPPGCGKTLIANALAAEFQVNYISISAPSIVSGMSGESEKALRDHFEEAKKSAPCLMFIDEIDAITPKRESAQREMEKRIVAQLLTCMDDLELAKTDGKPVIVLAATNRPDSLDPALRRGGRFDKEINMNVPNEAVREQILRALTRKWNLGDDIDFATLARRTPGCVGADLKDLVSTTANIAMKRYLETLEAAAQQDMEVDPLSEPLEPNGTVLPSEGNNIAPNVVRLRKLRQYCKAHPDPTPTRDKTAEKTESKSTIRITFADFLTALPQIQPSALREGFATIPSTTFDSIGALKSHINELNTAMIAPIQQPDLYRSVGITRSSGILLWGPPGCGKTLLAKAVANSSHANFISVKGPELLNKYVGESERAVRTLFTRARSSTPVIIFFDELDALVPRRDGTMSEASARVVNTLLTELDGVNSNPSGNSDSSSEGIYIIAATNRPDIIDPAMLRPGRLETLLYVGLPTEDDRVDILRTLTKKLKNFEWTDEITRIARSCDGFSGADLGALLRRAGIAAIKRHVDHSGMEGQARVEADIYSGMRITAADFRAALGEIRPSVSAEEVKRFAKLQREWGKIA